MIVFFNLNFERDRGNRGVLEFARKLQFQGSIKTWLIVGFDLDLPEMRPFLC